MSLCKNIHFNDDDLRLYEEELSKQGIIIKFNSIDFENKINSVPSFDSFDYSIKQQIRKTIALLYLERNK